MTSLSIRMTEKQEDEQKITIIKSWHDNPKANSLVFCLPLKIARKYNIDKPAHLCLIEQENGILLKKLELAK